MIEPKDMDIYALRDEVTERRAEAEAMKRYTRRIEQAWVNLVCPGEATRCRRQKALNNLRHLLEKP